MSARSAATIAVVPDRTHGLREAGCDGNGFEQLVTEWQAGRKRVFFFGSEPRVIYALRDQLGIAFPALQIAGICDADFTGPTSREIVAHIVASRPDVVAVDMPKRDFEAFAAVYRKRLAGMSLVNLPDAFPAYVHSTRAGGAAGQVTGRARFARLLFSQTLRVVAPKLRWSRASSAIHRDS